MESPPMSLGAIWSFLLLSSIHAPCLCGSAAAHFSNETDRLALLHFKHLITEDPLNSLSSWNHSTLHFFHWQGITCGGRRHLQRVTALNLTNKNLVGPISPFIGNLTFLRRIDLAKNSFHRTIPEEMGREILENLTQCSELNVLNLYGNLLTGRIPTELGSLTKLTRLILGLNSLTGSIPPSFGNLSSLTYLHLSRNSIKGRIPDELGQLVRLSILALSQNEVSGTIPPQLYNLSSINVLAVTWNRLHGNPPPNRGLTLPNLQGLYAGGNQFTGPIPLTSLLLASNRIFGSIPSEIQNLVSLTVLGMDDNFLTGTIPIGIGRLNKLGKLHLNINELSGQIPSSLGNITSLLTLSLRENNLSGSIPTSLGEIPISLGNCLSLEFLWLDGNFFQGSIPPTFSTLRGLQILDLSRNNLSGEIPKYLEKLALQNLNLSFNDFVGELPKQGVFGNASQVSVLGNSRLCGGIQELKLLPCSNQASKKRGKSPTSKVKISIVVVVLCLVLLSCFFATIYWKRKSRREPSATVSVEDAFVNVSYGELFKATDGFSSANLVGTGSFLPLYIKGL
ncbi:probable LRR receptor-like serine/threonine-protein kinase At3g47570 [Magnolia sinica]|uniref:probable LRR receptor-like serine/threonine-protein kinase At3g47570 n=1 Tax=Magnolia sinica TaxID=86752 RepID=UPI0026586EBB|nr:probable LRR receptor-like serine/threonine-protein kinase At3g47570 [Magnolia sinica]